MTDWPPAVRLTTILDWTVALLRAAEPTPAMPSLDSGHSRERRIPVNPALVEAKQHLHAILTSWALLIAEEKPSTLDRLTTTIDVAQWIRQHAAWLAEHPAYDDADTEIVDAATMVQHCIDITTDTRRFVGIHDGQPVYADHDQTTVEHAGRILRVDEERTKLKHAALDVDMPAGDVAATLRGLYDIDITAKQIHRMHKTDRDRRSRGTLGEHEGLSAVRWDGRTPIFRVSEVKLRIESQVRSRQNTVQEIA